VRTIQWCLVLALAFGGQVSRAQDWLYQVKDGDSIWNLCMGYANYKHCWMQLGDYNGLPDHDKLEPGSQLRIPIHWLSAVPQVGKALTVSGDVIYKGFAQPAVPLQPGQSLGLGAVLTSGEGTATIEIGNHGRILLRPNSELELDALSAGGHTEPSSELKLPRGDVEVQVRPEARSRFEIHTPAAVAAVRGTRYRVATTDSASMRGEVTSGLVQVRSGATVDVHAGYGVQARAGEAPQAPRKLLPAPEVDADSLNSPLPVTVRWSGQPGAVQWQADLFEKGENGKLLVTRRVDSPELVFEELAQGCYTLTLRGIDADGFNGMDTDSELCVLPPAPPVEEPRSHLGLIIWSVIATLMLL